MSIANCSSTILRLYKLREIPQHLQFNEFILTGYRPPSSFSDCLKSTLHLHNESFNIISHCETYVVAITVADTHTEDLAIREGEGEALVIYCYTCVYYI